MITESQVDFVINKIEASGINNRQLKDDLIDHFCCLIEIELTKGVALEAAFEMAYDMTTPNGIGEIQRETVFLLNYKKIKILKLTTFISGLIFSMILSTGCLFILLQLPYAAISMMLGTAGLAIVFFPLLLINHYKNKVSGFLTDRLKMIFGGFTLMFLAIGTWMKLLHTQGAAVVLVLGFVIFGFGFLPFLFFSKSKALK